MDCSSIPDTEGYSNTVRVAKVLEAELRLLERNAERVGKHGLGQARFQPPQGKTRAAVTLDNARPL